MKYLKTYSILIMKHKSVLLDEVIDYLNVNQGGKYIDATVGYAGHSGEV